MQSKKYIIVGNGISGVGASVALKQKGLRYEFYNLDTVIKKGNRVVISPGIPFCHKAIVEAKRVNAEVISELQLGYELCKDAKIVAVTGTNGKTTVTRLIEKMLNASSVKAVACGNVGYSFSQAVVKEKVDVFVVEASSFQLKTITTFKPHVAVITSLAPDHIDRHGSLSDYINAKLNVAKNMSDKDILTLSSDIKCEYLKNFHHLAKTEFAFINEITRGAYTIANKIYYYGDLIANVNDIKLEGSFNLLNVLLAICVAKKFGVSNQAIKKVISADLNEPYRFSLSYVKCGKCVYNNSKATNVASAVSASNEMFDETVMLLGGSGKGESYEPIFSELNKNVTRIITFGEQGDAIYKVAKEYGKNVERAVTLTEAILSAMSGKEKCVLFAPACASFDEFSSYVERGEFFDKTVLSL